MRAMWLTVGGISYFWFIGAFFRELCAAVQQRNAPCTDDQTLDLLVAALAMQESACEAAWSQDVCRATRSKLSGIVGVGSVFMHDYFAVATGLTSSVAWSLVWLTGLQDSPAASSSCPSTLIYRTAPIPGKKAAFSPPIISSTCSA